MLADRLADKAKVLADIVVCAVSAHLPTKSK